MASNIAATSPGFLSRSARAIPPPYGRVSAACPAGDRTIWMSLLCSSYYPKVTWVWLFWGEGWVGVAGCLVRLPFRIVLKCDVRDREGKPRMEQYGLDGLMASAEAVAAGLGPLAAGLARLAGEAGRAVTLEAMELLVTERGRDLLCGLGPLGLDGEAASEARVPRVAGADGVPRARAERGHARTIVTRLGKVVVGRIAYRSGVKGAGSLFPRDAVLNLPPCRYSWPLQRLAEMFARAVSYAQAREFVL